MTTTDPITLAREVLDVQKAHDDLCKRTGLSLPVSIDDMGTLASAAPDLARAVLAVADLADRLGNETTGSAEKARLLGWVADDIRAALNGGDAQ